MAPCVVRSLRVSCSPLDNVGTEVLAVNSVLPVHLTLPASVPEGQTRGFLQLLAGAAAVTDAATPIGEVVFQLENAEGANAQLSLALNVSQEGEVTAEVTQIATGLIVGSITVPAAPVA